MSRIEDLPSSLTVYGLPRSHWNCSLSSFDWEGHGGKRSAILEALGVMEARILEDGRFGFEEPSPNLLFLGPPGTGKTHLGVGIYRWAVAMTDLTEAVYVHIPSFCDEVKRSFDERGGPDPFDPIRSARFLLILDDIFGRDLSDWEKANVVPRLVDMAYQNRASLVLSSNVALSQIEEILRQHEVSRILENATVLKFRGEDHRLGID